MARRRIPVVSGREAVAEWSRAEDPTAMPRARRAEAVRFSLEELADRAPGRTVEVRVPPFGVTQCVEGPEHTRGTPPNVIETDAITWMQLVTGELGWAEAVRSGKVLASGSRADLSQWLPLFRG